MFKWIAVYEISFFGKKIFDKEIFKIGNIEIWVRPNGELFEWFIFIEECCVREGQEDSIEEAKEISILNAKKWRKKFIENTKPLQQMGE